MMTETKAIYLDAHGLSNMIKLFLGKSLLGVEIKYSWIKNKYPVKNLKKDFIIKSENLSVQLYEILVIKENHNIVF